MIQGLLFSQIGYDPRLPVRVVVRCTERSFVPAGATCRLTHAEAEPQETPVTYWGALWRSHWWVAQFGAGLAEGAWTIRVGAGGRPLFADTSLRVERSVLWSRTHRPMCIEMLKIRQELAKADAGWMDAGMMWQESNAQSAMVLGLLDVLEHRREALDPEAIEQITAQVVNGCDYLVLTQNEAEKRGHPRGSLCHDIIGHEHVVLPNDTNKAIVAWRRAARVAGHLAISKRQQYLDAANLAERWLLEEARPLGDQGLTRQQRGLPANTPIPPDEWVTRDLIMMLWCQLEAADRNAAYPPRRCIDLAEEIMLRQITETQADHGYFGHFREFASLPHAETSWTHSIIDKQFGVDAGGSFPNYLLPLIEMLRRWPDHDLAVRWRACLEIFTRGYLLPACHANPFYIIPQGVFAGQGALWFTATFHGMNAIYGLTAALALELADLLNHPELLEVAYGNLQWIAGLNAGLTASAIRTGCHVFRTDIPEHAAWPVSMIHGIGERTAGTWFNTRGVICNGFATGTQFKFDTQARQDEDGPFSLTDEDWIPHTAAWLSGVARLERHLER